MHNIIHAIGTVIITPSSVPMS